MLKNFLRTKTPKLLALLRVLRSILYEACRAAGHITQYFEKDPCVIIWIDGGFCSQIFRYLKGRWYVQRGFKVKYDISWYKDPVDCLGIESRDFVLLKYFPDLDFELAAPRELSKYRKLYSKSTRSASKYKGQRDKLKAPLYDFLYGLDWVIDSEKKYEELTQCLEWGHIHHILSLEAQKIEASIIEDKNKGLQTIGLHVRRGDMVSKRFAYGGKVLTSKYYEHILSLAADENSVVYVFSNGFDFVSEAVIPHIKCKYILADKTQGVHEDIFLCSLCDVQLAGQGSLGNRAYSFNKNKNRKLIRPVLRDGEEQSLPKYYAGSRGTVELVHLTEDMYEQ